MASLAVAGLASGCVFYVGAPAQTPHGLEDLRRGVGLQGLLRPGATREDALLAMGGPDRVVDGGRTLLYVAPVTSGELWVVVAGPGGGAAGALPLGHSVALAITFDDGGGYLSHRLEVAGLSEVSAAAQRALARR
jgi:hypothetical protein